MSRRSALAHLVRDAARLDRTQSDPVVAARNAIGVAAPLVIGALAGSAAFGLPSTIGALQTAFADRPGPYRLRLIRMVTTAVVAALTSTVAVACSDSTAASAVLLLVIGGLAGLLVAVGPSGTQVGVAAIAAAVVIGHQAQRPGVALHVGALVLLGGLGQVVLALAAWPLRRHRPERLSLAALYRALAALARRPPTDETGPPLGDQLAATRQTLFGLGHDHGPSVEAYRVLLDEAERIRRELIVLGGYRRQLSADAGLTAAVQSVLDGVAAVLDEIAAALTEARALSPTVIDPVRASVARTLDLLDPGDAVGAEAATRRAAAVRLRSLRGQLRAAVETAVTGATEGAHGDDGDPYGVRRLRDPLAIIRANVSLDSPVLRHALRLGVLIAGSDVVARLSHVDRGYWIPLTVVVVLRPDFATTFQRSVLRVIGTVLGLLLATALVHWVPGGQWYSIALVALFFFGMRLSGPANVGLSAVSLSALVVVLLGLAGVSPHHTVVPRGVDTLIGGALALLAALIWPTWERGLVGTRLAELLAAYREYTRTVADLTRDPDRLQRARMLARRARTNAQASLDRARAEPVPARREVELGEAVLAHSHRFINAMLIIEGLRPALRDAADTRPLIAFLDRAADVLAVCEQALRTDHVPPGEQRLRQLQQDLASRLEREPECVGGLDVAAALIQATDRIANSLDTLSDQLRRSSDYASTSAAERSSSLRSSSS